MAVISKNIQFVYDRIERAAARVGRSPDAVRLMAVSKNQTVETVEAAYAAGMRLFGENRVAEAAEKFAGRFPEAELHLIGHIQRNKAKRAVEIADVVQSLDSIRTLHALDKFAAEMNKSLRVLFEVNTSGEESKQGVRSEADLYELVDAAFASGCIKPAGLMTMAPFTREEQPVRNAFRKLKVLQEECIRRYGPESFPILSMGMSNDYEIAVEEGATLLRVGTALFGDRK